MNLEEACEIAYKLCDQTGYGTIGKVVVVLGERVVELETQQDELLKALAGLRKAIEEETFMGQPSYHSGDVKRAIGMANAAVIHAIAETEGVAIEENKAGETDDR